MPIKQHEKIERHKASKGNLLEFTHGMREANVTTKLCLIKAINHHEYRIRQKTR